MNKEAQIKQIGDCKFAWKASDAADESIIAYGYANYGCATKDMFKRFKITFSKNMYYTFLMIGRSYQKIGRCGSLESAQAQLQNQWVSIINA